MSTEDIIVRRATPADYEAVIDIRDDFMLGTDYMQTIYHEFLHNKNHLVYVAETVQDRKLVGLMNYLVDEQTHTFFPLSARVRPEFEQSGIVIRLWFQIRKDRPDLKYAVFDALLNERGQKMLSNTEVNTGHLQWNMLFYRVSNSSLKAWACSGLPQILSDGTLPSNPVLLSPSAETELLSSGRLETFLRRYSGEYIPGISATNAPVQLTSRRLRNQLLWSSATFVSYDQTSNIRGISFEGSYALKTKPYPGHLCANIFYFGDTCEDLLGHTIVHMRHLASVADKADVFLRLHFPLTIEMSAVDKELGGKAWPAGITDQTVLKSQFYLAVRILQSML